MAINIVAAPEATSDGGPAPSSSRVGVRSAQDGVTVQLDGIASADDLQAAITQLLGDVALDPNVGVPAQPGIVLTGSTTVGSPVVTALASTAALKVGFPVAGASNTFPAGTTVLSIDSGTQVHLSANATFTGADALTFSPLARVGVLRRTLPTAHPMFQYRTVSDVSEVRGVGVPVVKNVANPKPLYRPYPLQQYALYPCYDLKLQFSPRMYAELSDLAITSATPAAFAANTPGCWYDDAGTPQTFTYCNEWIRYTDYEIKQGEDFVTAQVGGNGGMIFRSTSGTINKTAAMGMPRVYLPDSIMRFIWYQVPYRYITSLNSYLAKYIGRVNQNDFYNWKRGQLLYLGWNATRYSPPNPLLMRWAGGVWGFSQAKLCDIELTFLLTMRGISPPITDAPTPANSNFIPAGHNLEPSFIDKLFHYATTAETPTDNTKGTPNFRSFPVEILFMDPDVGAGGGL